MENTVVNVQFISELYLGHHGTLQMIHSPKYHPLAIQTNIEVRLHVGSSVDGYVVH